MSRRRGLLYTDRTGHRVQEGDGRSHPNFKFVSYPDAKHGFSNPAADETGKKFQLDIAYNSQADAESWKELQALLQSAFPEIES